MQKAKNVKLNKEVINIENKHSYKAMAKVMDECMMHHLFTQIVQVTKIPKAKKIVVEFTGDEYYLHDYHLIAEMLEETATPLEDMTEALEAIA